jgi:glutamyl-tRNA reductase
VIYAALAASRRVRSETSLGRGTASVAGAAVKWLMAEGCVKDSNLLILGSGVVARDVVRRLVARRTPVRSTVIASRSLEHAGRLASEIPGASVIRWSDVKSALHSADVIVGAFQSSDGALTASDLRADGARSRWIADLSMPRAFDPAACELPGVRLRNVDDFADDAALMQRLREQAVPAAEGIARHEAALGFVRFTHRANRRAVERVA